MAKPTKLEMAIDAALPKARMDLSDKAVRRLLIHELSKAIARMRGGH